MAIQGIEIPKYINTPCFCIFFIFQFFFKFLYVKQNKNKNWKIIKQNMLNKEMHKTRLTQNNKAKHTSNAKKTKTKKKKREREK